MNAVHGIDFGNEIIEAHDGKTGGQLAVSLLAESDPELAGRLLGNQIVNTYGGKTAADLALALLADTSGALAPALVFLNARPLDPEFPALPAELERALRPYQEDERCARQLRDARGLAESLNAQAWVLHRAGKAKVVLSFLMENERVLRETGDQDGLQHNLVFQAFILEYDNRPTAVTVLLEEAESICRRLGNETALAIVTAKQAVLRTAPSLAPCRVSKRAKEASEQAIRTSRPTPSHRLLAACPSNALLRMGRDLARQWMTKIRSYIQAIHHRSSRRSTSASCAFRASTWVVSSKSANVGGLPSVRSAA